MSAPQFRSLHFEDDALDRNFRSVEEVLDELVADPRVDGVIHQDQDLIAGQDNILAHGLGRKPLSYVIHGQDAPAIVFEDTTQRTAEVIVLRTTTDVTCTIEVY